MFHRELIVLVGSSEICFLQWTDRQTDVSQRVYCRQRVEIGLVQGPLKEILFPYRCCWVGVG